MVRDVVVYSITTGYGVYGGLNFQAGYFIHVYLDDSTGTLQAKLTTSSEDGGGSLIGIIIDGPNLFYGTAGTVEILTTEPYYKYCEGTTLRYIGISPNVPYAFLGSTPDAVECYIAPVCDLEITGSTIEESSAPDVADGEIQITATASNGPVKYFLGRDFDYATEGNTTGQFTGLLAGNYTVWARNSLTGCVRSITVTVTVTQNYGIRWSAEYDDLAGGVSRIEVLERAYEGVETELEKVGAQALVIEWLGDPQNQYKPIVPSNATFQLLVRTEGEFNALRTADDRKYKVLVYKNGTVRWAGFVIPEFINEPYLFQPYYINITATDGLGELATFDFVDNSAQYTNNQGNPFVGRKKAIYLIAEILKKCPTGFNIRSFVDVWETTMDPDLDPLDQVFVPSEIFYKSDGTPLKCDEVLGEILKPFKAQISMSNGCWRIRRIQTSVASTHTYREFDEDGVFIDDGTDNILKELQGAEGDNYFVDVLQTLSHIRNYGFFKITHDLKKDANIIDHGDFEKIDIEGDFFKGWNFTMGQTGITFGFQAVDNGDSKGAFFCRFQTSNNQNDSVLYTPPIPINLGTIPYFAEGEVFTLKVDLMSLLQLPNTFKWCRVAWRVRITNNVTGDFYDMKAPYGETLQYEINEEVLNDLYLEDHGKFETFELGPFGIPVYSEDMTIQVSFHFHNHQGGDFNCVNVGGDANDFSSLRAFDASVQEGQHIGKRIYVKIIDDTDVVRFAWYTLAFTTADEVEPSIIRPNDYNALAFPYQWVLQEQYAVSTVRVTSKIVVDNVRLSFFPVIDLVPRVDPPETVNYSQEVNPFIKPNFEETVVLGDVPVFNNSKLLYKGYFTLEDGTPTVLWAREGVSEELPLNEIGLNDVVGQMTNPVRCLSGKIKSSSMLFYGEALRDYLDQKRFIQTRMVCYDRRQEYEVNLIEVLTGEGGEPPVQLGAYSDGFDEGFLI